MALRISHATGVVLVLLAVFFSCIDLPLDPMLNPDNASIRLILGDREEAVVDMKTPLKVGLEMRLTNLLDTVRITSGCSVIDTMFLTDSTAKFDTLWFSPVFNEEGECVLTAEATMHDGSLKNKTHSLTVHVLPEKPGIYFVRVPPPCSLTTATTDTLLLVTSITGSAKIPAEYTLSVAPEAADSFFIITYSAFRDTVRIIAQPNTAGVYTLTLVAATSYNDKQFTDTAEVKVIVKSSSAPDIVRVPAQVIAGKPDTLIFAIDNSIRPDTLTIALTSDPPPDPAMFSIVPTGPDSIVIAVKPDAAAGSATIGVITGNGTETDTSWYTLTIISPEAAFWNTATLDLSLVEGTPFSLDLSSYLDAAHAQGVALSTDVGSIEGTTWSYSPEWGCAEKLTATVTASKGDVSLGLKLSLSIAAGDTDKPVLALTDPDLDGKKVSSSQITVSCTATDATAGIDRVVLTSGAMSVVATLQDEHGYSGVIDSLVHGVPREIVITATDRSRTKNSRSITITVTRDTTLLDAEPPVIVQTAGPKSGDRVTTAEGTLNFTITDNSGVDSVWWTLGSEYYAASGTDDDGGYAVHYTLTDFGKNSIVLYAKDGSGSGNEGTQTITLNYNTEVTAVTPSGPQDKATGVSLTPSFIWTGGTDADGDSVFYRVLYGTSATALSQTTSILTGKTVTLESAATLTPTTVYYWQVVAWSKVYPDTVRSVIISFTTLDTTAEDHTGPQIAQTAGPEDGDRVTSATGTVTVSVSDPNGVASVTAKLNTGTAQPLTAGSNSTYTYNYTLTAYGKNAIIFTTIDGSANGNSSSDTVTINYNTEPTAIELTTPAADANDVAISPTFKWSGGDDADGDGVTVTVRYGTSQTNLGSTATVSGKTAAVGSPLAYNQTYYWQVTATSASTVFPDVVRSSVETFSTEGSLPTISEHPLSQSKEAGQSVTFNVTASANGFGTLSYQWQRNDTNITGATAASYPISSVTTSMNGNTYSCVVKNAVGSITSNSATLTVTAIPKFTVSFDMHGGTAIASQTVQRDGFTQEPPVPVRAGYAFKGWYTSSTFTTAFDFSTPITADRTIHARWAQVYSVTYYPNTADGGNVPVDSKKYESGEQVTVAGNTGNLNKNGFTFSGWTTSSGGTGTVYNNPNTITMGSAAISLYAKWVQITYSVTYDANGGTGTVPIDNTPYTGGSTVTIQPNLGLLVNNPASFVGWSTTNGTTYACGQQVAISGNLELYAKYSTSQVMDNDGNVYDVKNIGGTMWMVQNLKTTKYRDGNPINYVASANSWASQTIGAYAWPAYSIGNKTYGAIYNVNAVRTGKVAPAGWRIANEADWTELRGSWEPCDFVDWPSQCPSGNSSGLSLVPSGYIYGDDGYHSGFDQQIYMWEKNCLITQIYGIRSGMYFAVDDRSFESAYETYGCTIRCVKE